MTNVVNTSGSVSSGTELRARLRSLTYAVDHTGVNPANKVSENRTLSDANGENYRHIIPKAAPFFAESVRVFHTQTNEELIRGQDFYCVGTFIKAVTNVVNHQRIAWCIIFDDPRISGEYRIEYQTIGGEFILDEQQMAETLANYLENPRTVDWETIVGRPLTFPPLPHDVDVLDTTGWEGVIQGEAEIRDAILALIKDEEKDHPGYSELLSDILRLHNRQESFDAKLSQYKQNSDAGLDAYKQEIRAKLDKISEDIPAQEQSLTNLINRAKSELTNLIGTKAVEITNNYTVADTTNLNTAKAYTNSEVAKAKTYSDQNNTALATELRAKDRAIETLLNDSVNSLNTKVTEAKTALANTLNGAVTSLTQADATTLSTSKAYTDSKVGGLRTEVENLIANSNNVNQATNSAIENVRSTLQAELEKEVTTRTASDKTFTRNVNELTAAISALEGRVKTNIANTVAEETRLRKVDQTILRNDIEIARRDNNIQLTKVKGELQTQIVTNRSEITNSLRDETNARTSKDNELTAAIESLKTSVTAKSKEFDTRITNAIGELNGKFVTFTENESISGLKTFTGGTQWKVTDSTTASVFTDGEKFGFKLSKRGHTANDKVLFMSPDSDKLKFKIGVSEDITILDSRLIYPDESKKGSRVSGKLIIGDAGGSIRVGNQINMRDNDIFVNIGVAYKDGRGLIALKAPTVNDAATVNLTDDPSYVALLGPSKRGNETVLWSDRMLDVPDIFVRSDERYKDNIKPIENPIDKLMGINGYTYNLIDNDNVVSAGVVAQEVKEVFPEIVKGTEEEKYIVQYNGLIALLIETVKQQELRIKRLENEIKELCSIVHEEGN